MNQSAATITRDMLASPHRLAAALDAGADVEVLDVEDISPLVWACKRAPLESAQRLCAAGANPDRMAPADATTVPGRMRARPPLHFAVYRDDGAALARMLLAAGADIEARNNIGASVLNEAVYNARLALVEVLIAADADVSTTDAFGKNLLHAAVSACFAETERNAVTLLDMLDSAGAFTPEMLEAKNTLGQTPLALAVCLQSRTAIERFITAGADLNTQNAKGDTPVMEASLSGKIATLRLILGRGADPNIANKDGYLPLHRALDYNATSTAQALLEAGADPDQRTHPEVETPREAALSQGLEEHLQIMTLNDRAQLTDTLGHSPSNIAAGPEL